LRFEHKEPQVGRQCRSCKDDQPLPPRVVTPEQERHDQDAEQVPAEMGSIRMHEVPGRKPPRLAREHRAPLVAQGRQRTTAQGVEQQQHDDQHHRKDRYRTTETQ